MNTEISNTIDNSEVQDTLDIQMHSFIVFWEAMGYELVQSLSKKKLMLVSNVPANQHNLIITFNSGVRIYNTLGNMVTPPNTNGANLEIENFVFSSYLYNIAVASKFVSEVGLFTVPNTEDYEYKIVSGDSGVAASTSKYFVKFVNNSEYLWGKKEFIKGEDI